MSAETLYPQLLWNEGNYSIYAKQRKKVSKFILCNKKEQSNKTIASSDEIILQWEHTCLPIDVKSIIFEKLKTRNDPKIKILWSEKNRCYCDTIYLGNHDSKSILETELVISVDFEISSYMPIWSTGLLLLCDRVLSMLHIFDTSFNKKIGQLCIHYNANSKLSESVQYLDQSKTLSILTTKYDGSIKKSFNFLNTYSIPSMKLLQSTQLLDRYQNHIILPMETIDTNPQSINCVVCSYCEILQKINIQWTTNGKPWFETELANVSFNDGIVLHLQKVKLFVTDKKSTQLYATFDPFSLSQTWDFHQIE